MKILIMGLPDSGKTWLGERMSKHFNIPFWDADVVRKIYNDWDFSSRGRERQSLRMRKLAEIEPISISAFICPLPGYIRNFFPDKLIWMDTVKECQYEDTNKLFKPPQKYDVRITKWIDENQLFSSLDDINRGMMDIQNFSNELMQKLDKL
jgi:adenylylsulfate kinase